MTCSESSSAGTQKLQLPLDITEIFSLTFSRKNSLLLIQRRTELLVWSCVFKSVISGGGLYNTYAMIVKIREIALEHAPAKIN